MNRLIVDMSSVCWTSLLAGKDKENGYEVIFEGKPVNVNPASFGYENAMNMIVHGMNLAKVEPSQMLLVVEGKNSKALRQEILRNYKESRATRPLESYEEFNKLKEMLVTALTEVGASAVTQDGLEADDVIGYLSRNLDGERYILSRDGDLLVLTGEHVHLIRGNDIDVNTYGPFPVKYVSLRKALVGKDDEVPGAKGFGEKSFLDLYALFGDEGCDALLDLITGRRLEALAEDVHELKSLQKIIDSADAVYSSWAAARLYPERVNTMKHPLQWRAGMVKPLRPDTDERLKPYAGRVRLIHPGNYDQAVAWAAPLIRASPVVALDIETSTPKESDEWLAAKKGVDPEDGANDLGIDVFGSFLVSLQITFGSNGQYTLVLPHKHVETDTVKNLTLEQVRKVAELIPQSINTVIQNVSFEYSVLYQEWGSEWKDNGWHGFIPNGIDTAIMSTYVDENRKKGLKDNSKLLLDYEQVSYEQITVLEGLAETLPKGGKLISSVTNEGVGTWEKRRYKMDELTAEHVKGYAADDTICTLALYNHYRTIMEIENTWDVFMEVEQLPAYLTALAYVQGVPISLQRMAELELADNQTYDKAWATVRQFLMAKGWEGTVCPVWVPDVDFAWKVVAAAAAGLNPNDIRSVSLPADIKEAVLLYTGKELNTKVRKIERLADAIAEQFPDEPALAKAVRDQDAKALTALVKSRFTGEPVLDIDSPKKMQHLLYDVIGIPPRLLNKVTPTERQDKQELVFAVLKWNKIMRGGTSDAMTPKETELIKKKAKTDAFALKWAIKFDATPEQIEILNALQAMATVSTRRSLYYGPYKFVRHWKDGLVHANANQSAAVTGRYSFSGPNWQQQPKKGEGIKFREIVLPHVKDGLIGSIDFVGQELRLMAGQSGDANMMACYVGDKLKDIHSITAAGAMSKKWTVEKRQGYEGAYGYDLDRNSDDYGYDLFLRLRKASDKAVAKDADDLRKDAKNVNFGATFDAQAPKLSVMLTIPLADAQAFLEAKYAMFPRVETWKAEIRDQLKVRGYVTTMLGARRHLAAAIMNPDKWEAERAGRQGPNFMIQGSAGEMTKLAMGRIWRSGIMVDPQVRFYFPVHDELVWSAHKSKMAEVTKLVHDSMAQPYSTLPVPILGSISVGRTFGEQVEAGDWFVDEVVQKAIEKALAS